MVETNFELQLIVIGLMLAVYWQSIPQLVVPSLIGNAFVSFNLLKSISIISGFGWFATLLIGAFSLVYPDRKKLRNYFKLSFKLSNFIILGMLVFIIASYLTYIVI